MFNFLKIQYPDFEKAMTLASNDTEIAVIGVADLNDMNE